MVTSSTAADLVVAPCEHDAALFAIEHWHYSRVVPSGKLIKYGVWEGEFVGAVVFGRGASPALGSPYGLGQHECCELVRVALREHRAPVTQIVARCLKQLRESNPGMRLVVSFADPAQGHHGGIYQAGGWLYMGQSSGADEVLFEGRWLHNRMLRPTGWGTLPRVAQLSDAAKAALPRRKRPGKYRYVMPLDRAIRRSVSALALPYPQPAVEGSVVSRPQSPGEGASSILADCSLTPVDGAS